MPALSGGHPTERTAESAGSGTAGVTPREHAVHLSLIRPMHYLGVEREVIAVEATIIAAMLFGVGPHVVTLIVAAVVVLVMHPTMVWLTARDPQITEMYLRHRTYADYYAPHQAIGRRGRVAHVRLSIERVR